MTKRNKFYQIGFIVSTVVCIGLMLAMGIIAVQKSMKLNLGFQVNPSFECKIVYNGNTIFCNTAKNGESLVVGDGVSLNGNNLTLNQNFSGLGAGFTLTIHNYTALKTEISVSGTGANGDTLTLDAYTSGTAPYGNITITATGTSATLTFAEWVPRKYTLSYNSNGGGGSMESSEFEEGVPQPLSENEFVNKDTYYCKQFLGWSEDPNATKATYTNGQSITISQDTTLYAVWDSVWTIKAYDGTNTNFNGYYYVEMGEYPQTYKSDDAIKVYSTEAKTTDITTSTTTSGTIGYGSDGYRYYWQNAMAFQHKSDATHKFSTVYGVSGWYKIEPLRWIIIGGDKSETTTYGTGSNKNSDNLGTDELLLLSEYVLYAVPFDGSHHQSSSSSQNRYYTSDNMNTTSDVWCSINGWTGSRGDSDPNTNGGVDYINQADAQHVKGEKYFAKLSGLEAIMTANSSLIVEKTLSTTYKGGTDSSSHKIFLLGGTGSDSFLYSNYLGALGDSKLIGYATGFAHATSACGSGSGSSASRASYWWLRFGYYYRNSDAYFVTDDGYVDYNGVYFSNRGVRPSFVLNLA